MYIIPKSNELVYCVKKEPKSQRVEFFKESKTSLEKKPSARSLQTLHTYSMPKQGGHDVFT